ncbi:MAG: carboxypeptidase-like regulatory domain-containing protein [Anditalea sp.]
MENFITIKIMIGHVIRGLIVLLLVQGMLPNEAHGSNPYWIEKKAPPLGDKGYDENQPVLRQEISGTVQDENGESLIGVSILEKGTGNGTITDLDGSYSITVEDGNSVLVFSYVGYQRQEITVNNQSEINVSLAPDNTLEQVVVTALGIEKDKRDLGYSVLEGILEMT